MNVKEVYNKIKEIKETKGWNNVDFLYACNNLLEEKLKEKNISGLNIEEFIEPNGIAERIAKDTTIKRSQLRKFFNGVKELKQKIVEIKPDENLKPDIRIRVTALIPKLAYASGRKTIDKNFYEFMKLLLLKLKDGKRKDFEAFDQIFEAIIAYHTYHHPKEE
jgi:CRISPR-associated protein Csm2